MANTKPDSTQVIYKPAGTGAVATTVQSKLRERVSVKDFGAKGDNTTNDTDKINSVPSFPAEFPPGNYKIGADIAGLGKQFIGFGGVSFTTPYKVRSSVAYGVGALAKNTGYDTASPSLTDKNVAIGTYSLYNNTTGYHNTAVGDEALFTNVAGSQNTAVGMNALYNNTGSSNTAVGVSALLANTSGINNTAIGRAAGIKLVSANYNTLIGRNCSPEKVNGNNDTYVGAEIAWSATTSLGDNAVLGWRAAYSLSGQYNTAVGNESLYNATGATNCVVVGRRSAFSNTANDTTAIGSQSLQANTTGARQTAVGARAGYSTTTDNDGTFVGWQAGYEMTGANSIAIGSSAGAGSGSSNTIIGSNAGTGLTTGGNNVIIGASVANNLQNGNQNTIIGNGATAPVVENNNQLVVVAGTSKLQITDGLQWICGAGNPESSITAPVGSLYTRTDGSRRNTLYVKETGTANTGWTPSITANRQSAVPSSGTWAIGDIIYNSVPTAGGGASPYLGWVCVTAGTAGTPTCVLSTTCSAAIGTTETVYLSVVSSAGMYLGQTITSARTGGNVTRIISAITGKTLTLSTSINNVPLGASVSDTSIGVTDSRASIATTVDTLTALNATSISVESTDGMYPGQSISIDCYNPTTLATSTVTKIISTIVDRVITFTTSIGSSLLVQANANVTSTQGYIKVTNIGNISVDTFLDLGGTEEISYVNTTNNIITLKTSTTATANTKVLFSAPVWKTFGAIAA